LKQERGPREGLPVKHESNPRDRKREKAVEKHKVGMRVNFKKKKNIGNSWDVGNGGLRGGQKGQTQNVRNLGQGGNQKLPG